MSDTGPAGYGRAMLESAQEPWLERLSPGARFFVTLFGWGWYVAPKKGHEVSGLFGWAIVVVVLSAFLIFLTTFGILAVSALQALLISGPTVVNTVPLTLLLVVSGVYLIVGLLLAFLEWYFNRLDKEDEDLFN